MIILNQMSALIEEIYSWTQQDSFQTETVNELWEKVQRKKNPAM